ncbi:MAG: hypothetical protein IPN71_09995, partial [Fibrobacteres bacterium]|nr:hypothetical protein [Fibrobacterota bacterium]
GLSFLALSEIVTEPSITAMPGLMGKAGKPYTYQPTVQSVQPSALRFNLLSGPTGAVVDSLTGKILWTPTDAQVGTQAFTLRARGVESIATAQSWVVTVQARNQAPVWKSALPSSLRLGQSLDYQPLAQDPEGKPVSYAWVTKPAAAVVQADGHLTWTATGTAAQCATFCSSQRWIDLCWPDRQDPARIDQSLL